MMAALHLTTAAPTIAEKAEICLIFFGKNVKIFNRKADVYLNGF